LASGNCQSVKSTERQTHFGPLQRNIKYYESVVFSYSRIRRLRWKRAGGTCSHGETCGEEHCDNRYERGAQRGEGNKESCAHCGLQSYAIVEGGLRLLKLFTALIRLAARRGANKPDRTFERNAFETVESGFVALFWGE
jgi:hypothetical protein